MSEQVCIPLPSDLDPHIREAEELSDKNYGFWLYLMSDAIIFALLFVSYVVLSGNTAGGPNGRALFDLNHVAVETAVLLLSSLTFGAATVSMERGARSSVMVWLLITGLLGLGFLGLELSEFRGMIEQGAGPSRSAFLSAFFTLVGTHGLHVTVGLLWLVIMVVQVAIFGLTPAVVSRLDRLGVFWHFLDIIWIGVFSIVYLAGIVG